MPVLAHRETDVDGTEVGLVEREVAVPEVVIAEVEGRVG
jgi:hypothetical protein